MTQSELPIDVQYVVNHLMALKAHGHGQVVAKVQDHKVIDVDENRKHRLK